MPKGTFKQYLLYEMFTHKKAGFTQTNEESPLFFVYRIKSRFSVKRRNPNPSPTWKIKFGFLSFGPSGETRTPGILLPNVCRNLQPALYRPLWHFPLLRQFLFNTLSPCLFQGNLSSFGICVGLDSVY